MPQGGVRGHNLDHLIFFFYRIICVEQYILMKTDYLCVTSVVRVHDTEWGWRSTLMSPLKCYFIFSDLCIYFTSH